VLGAVGDGTTEVGCGIDASEIAFDDDVRVRAEQFARHQGSSPSPTRRLEPPPRNLWRDGVGIQESEEVWDGIVLADAEEIRVPPMPSEV